MKCPKCGSLIVHTYDTKLDKGEKINAQYRYNICEKQHTFPTVEMIAKRKTRNAETIAIELSTEYRKFIEFSD